MKIGDIITENGKQYKITNRTPTDKDYGKLVVKITEGFIMGPENWTPNNWRICEAMKKA